MSIADWTGRLTTVGATANEVAAITSAYYADPTPVQQALDVLVGSLSNAGLLAMLNTWRTSGGPFEAGFPSGGLPFGTGVAVLTGVSADDAYPIGAGTGAKMTSIPAGDIPPLNNIPAPTGDVAMAAHKLTGLADAAANTDALNRQSGDARYVQTTVAAGAELAYAQITANFATVTATTSATAQDIGLTTGALTYAAVPVLVEFFTPRLDRGTGAISIVLYDGATQLGTLGIMTAAGGSSLMKTRITPSAASHTYLPKAFVDAGTGQVEANDGALGHQVPAYFRITRV